MPTQHCQCGAKYRFSEDSIGKRAKCEKCGAVFVLESGESGVIPVAGESTGPAGESACGQDASPPIVDFVQPSRGYAENLLWTLLFPSSPRNLVTFLILWGILTIAFAFMFPCLVIPVLIGCWYAAFRFAVVESAAAGESNIPDVVYGSNFAAELLYPVVKWLASWAVVLLPALAWLTFTRFRTKADLLNYCGQSLEGISGLLKGFGASAARGSVDELIFFALVGAGLFFWPMVLLCITLGGLDTIYRVDLMVLTMARSFPAYLLTVLMVAAVVTLRLLLAEQVQSGITAGVSATTSGMVGSALLRSLLSVWIWLYCDIVAMRAIGLYFHHFRHRFAWGWG